MMTMTVAHRGRPSANACVLRAGRPARHVFAMSLLAIVLVTGALLAVIQPVAAEGSAKATNPAAGQWALESPQLPIDGFMISLYPDLSFEAWRAIRGNAPEIFSGTYEVRESGALLLAFTHAGNQPVPVLEQPAQLNPDGSMSLHLAPDIAVRFVRVTQ